MFSAWIIFVVFVYSTNPGGVPPFQQTDFLFTEFYLEDCQARISQIVTRPKSFVVAATGEKPTFVTYTIFNGWNCDPIQILK